MRVSTRHARLKDRPVSPHQLQTDVRRRGGWLARCAALALLAMTHLSDRGTAAAGASAAQDPASSAAAANAATGQDLTPRQWLVVGPVGAYGRTNLHTDAVAAALVAGNWRPPRAGDVVTLPDGAQRAWRAVAADDAGALEGELRGGGYAFTTISLPADGPAQRVLILEAGGHSAAYVNGAPRYGDPYGAGWARVPVALQPGDNQLLLRCRRGARVRLSEPKAVAEFDARDLTVPDLIVGEAADTWAAIPVLNATTEWRAGLEIEVRGPDGPLACTPIPPLPPLIRRKCGFAVRGPAPAEAGPVNLALRLVQRSAAGREVLDTTELTLAARHSRDKHKRTFISRIDGSVQYYAVTPAHPPADEQRPPALVLSLHGASVEATNQANAYDHKAWAHVVAPTNRRPYGFDWEDWGRQDALEVLDLTARQLGADPQRIYLTGHSMGGHGTWQVGAHFPDRFAAIAPSAGWISFASYAGGPGPLDDSPVAQMLYRAAAPSDTLSLSRNYLQFGIYVLHGDADDNVPVREARAMRAHLGGYHPDFAYYERPGAGHWWGSACVDWPPLFAFLRDHTRPPAREVRRFEFVTASPGNSAQCHWLLVHGQVQALRPSSVEAQLDVAQRRFTLGTQNVARLMLDLNALRPAAAPEPGAAADAAEGLIPGAPVHITIDAHQIDDVAWPEAGRLWLVRADDTWQTTSAPPPELKSPARYGPFRAVFDRRCLLVVGTGGSAEENAWALAKARYDAETFLYRGNGVLDIVRDRDFDPAAEPDRNVVLYGNAATNRAWGALLAGCPVDVRRDAVTVGQRRLAGDDLAALFIRPRAGSDVALVGVVGGTGLAGLRLTERLPLFLSGVAWPDCTVLDATTLTRGASGVRCAGFFGADWQIASGEFAWREPE